MRRIVYISALLVASMGNNFELMAQQPTTVPTPPPSGTAPAPSADAEKRFQDIAAKWKETVKELNSVQAAFQTAKPAERPELAKRYETARATAMELQPQLKASVEPAFAANPKNEDATEFLFAMIEDAAESENGPEALRIIQLLQKNNVNKREFKFVAAQLNWANNNFPEALELATSANTEKSDMVSQGVLAEMKKYDQMWKDELAARANDAKLNSDPRTANPRVKISTTKGDIVVELFETEAPNTVANFVSLVDSKYYDGTYFHRVLANFMAQGGDPNTRDADRSNDGGGGPGYTIKCECSAPNARKHFRGTLSMAKTAAPNTGGSQFFLTFRPTTQLDGLHTVFGRVVEGLDVLDKLQRIDPQDPNSVKIKPDYIKTATVLNKRPHEYKPETSPAAPGQ
jgi:cyclophilin family peptidyl-prolyl cis-trans isomerase